MFTRLGSAIDYYWFMFSEYMIDLMMNRWPQMLFIITWSLGCGLIGWWIGKRKKK